jgi:hypothetical protein
MPFAQKLWCINYPCRLNITLLIITYIPNTEFKVNPLSGIGDQTHVLSLIFSQNACKSESHCWRSNLGCPVHIYYVTCIYERSKCGVITLENIKVQGNSSVDPEVWRNDSALLGMATCIGWI